jgi:hypothetical protein
VLVDLRIAMADDPLENAVEIFSAPIEGIIASLGKGIADAQRALDLNSIAMQKQLDTDPELAPFGLQATWYQLPRVDLQLTLAMTVAEDQTVSQTPRFFLIAQPVSAAYQNHFNFDAKAASTINLSIVPVPPPRSADQAVAPRLLTPAQVQSKALASPAKFVTVKGPDGTPIPTPDLRFDIHYNAAARLWYVLQYDASDKTVTPVIVTVDDVTRAVTLISPGSS